MSQTQIAARYGKFADQVLKSSEPLPFNVDGCAPQTGISAETLAQRLYSDQQLIDLPEPAVDASIGCGNPIGSVDLWNLVADKLFVNPTYNSALFSSTSKRPISLQASA